MQQEDPTDKILAFARHVGKEGDAPETVARDRGWIDVEGRPTDDGRALLRALDEQKAQDAIYRLDP
ncbi:MAG: hypothetical protein V2I65_02320 [Paracoccaceae bacterium]|jgi:hypothetical protein|nr:hypothetical protein [Paracoccaceae bacterium]